MIIFGLIVIAVLTGLFISSGDNSQNVQSVPPTPYHTNEEYSPTPDVQGTSNTSTFSPLSTWDYYDSDGENEEIIEDKKSQADDLSSKIQDLNWEIGRLRRNTDSYNHDEFSSKLKKLQNEAEDLSQEATDLGINDSAQSLDDASYKLKGLRREVDSESSFFYREREDEIDSKLRRSVWDTDDAESSVDDYSFDLDNY